MNYPTFEEKQKTVFSRLNRLRSNPTESEILFENKLKRAGIKYIFQKSFIKGTFYCIVDFYIPKPHKLVIEIDGKYHDEPTQVLKDFARDKYLTIDRGFKVIRIKNEDVPNFDINTIINNKA